MLESSPSMRSCPPTAREEDSRQGFVVGMKVNANQTPCFPGAGDWPGMKTILEALLQNAENEESAGRSWIGHGRGSIGAVFPFLEPTLNPKVGTDSGTRNGGHN